MLQRILKEDCETVVNKYEVYRTALIMQMEKKRQEQMAQQWQECVDDGHGAQEEHKQYMC